MNLALLASVNEDLTRLTSVDEMMRVVGAKIGAHLNLSFFHCAEINEAERAAVVLHEWHRKDVPPLAGVYPIADLVTDEFRRAARAGEIVVVRDAAADPRIDTEKHAALKARSFVSVPLLHNGQWRFMLAVGHAAPHDWLDDEIELLRELTMRLWTQVERARGEDALRESEERYRTLFNLSPVAVYSIDASGVIQNFNRHAVELWGREPALGDTDERFCGSYKLFRPDGSFMPHEQCPMAEVVAGKIPAAHDAEVLIERPDGSRVTVIVNIRPVKNDRGDVTGAINCFYDITSRKQAEEARAKLASIVEFSDDAILSEDLNGRITSWNRGAERLFGYDAQEAIGQPATMLVPRERFDEDLVMLERVRRGDPIEHYETVRLCKNGRPIDLSLTLSPIRNREGQVVGASQIARDITDRKNAEKALHQSRALLADRAGHLEQLVAERTTRLRDTISELEHFSYTITHDMRAPLRAMQGFAGILLSESADQLTSESAGYLRRIMEGARRMDALIRDSLQYAKVVREEIPLTAVDPTPVLQGILESYSTLQPPRAEVQIVEPLPPIVAHEASLFQCFSNLLANATKFVKPGVAPKIRIWAETRPVAANSSSSLGGKGRVEEAHSIQEFANPTIRQSSPSGVVRLWFEDNGIGIPPEHQDRIFSMFQQLDKSYEGTGIGLALIRRAAERMGGKVGVESELGQGSRFWLEFKQANPSIQ